MDSSIKVSVIIPVYNVEKYLRQCLNSVTNQTLREIEIICIDDGSKDGSLRVLKEFEAKDSRIKILFQEHKGPAHARNRGIREAQGKYIGTVDSDDRVDIDFFEKLFLKAEKTGALIAKAQVKLIEKDGRQRLFSQNKFVRDKTLKLYASFASGHCCAIYNRKFLIDNQIFYDTRVSRGEDSLFLLSLTSKTESVCLVDDSFYYYIMRDGSLSHNATDDYFEDKLSVTGIIIEMLNSRGCFDNSYYVYLKNRFAYLVNVACPQWQKNDYPQEKVQSFNARLVSLFYRVHCGTERDAWRKNFATLDLLISEVEKTLSLLKFVPPAFSSENVPVVFCIDDRFAKYLFVVLTSLVEKRSSKRNYDILIFDGGVSLENRILLASFSEKNVSVRFVDTEGFVEKTKGLKLMVPQMTSAAYYRLFVASVLSKYDRIVYLDSDILINTDIAELFDIDLRGNVIAAVEDYGITVRDAPYSGRVRKYLAEYLKMKDPTHYFNSGVLVMDLKKIREENLEDEFLRIARINNQFLHDQNVLNIVLEGRWLELSFVWNFYGHMPVTGKYPDFVRKSIFNILDKQSFKIIHYITGRKPWWCPEVPLADIFWQYARRNPEIEFTLLRYYENAKASGEKKCILTEDVEEYAKTISQCIAEARIRLSVKDNARWSKNLPGWCVRLMALFIFDKATRKRWRERHMDLTPKNGIDINRTPELRRDSALKRFAVRTASLFIFSKSKRKAFRAKHLNLNPKDGVDVKRLSPEERRVRKQKRRERNPIVRLFNALVPATRAKIAHSEKHLAIQAADQTRKILESLKAYRLQSERQFSELKRELAQAQARTTALEKLLRERTDKFSRELSSVKSDLAGELALARDELGEKVLSTTQSLLSSVKTDLVRIEPKLMETRNRLFWFTDYQILGDAFPTLREQLRKRNPHATKELEEELFRTGVTSPRIEGYENWYSSLVKSSFAYKNAQYFEAIPKEVRERELQLWFKLRNGYDLDLVNPKTFNEKIQWLKLYDATPLKTRLADKYEVREWIKEQIGEKYLVPLLGVYDSFDEIDFDALPEKFVIKTTHGSSFNIIVKDKSKLDKADAKKKLTEWLALKFEYCGCFEMHYEGMTPRIIVEEFLDIDEEGAYDWQAFCFNGELKVYRIIVGGAHSPTHGIRYFYDENWNKLEMTDFAKSVPGGEISKPDNFEELELCMKKLCKQFLHVRVDFLRLRDGSWKFGEMTFTTSSGSMQVYPKSADRFLGDMLELPKKINLK